MTTIGVTSTELSGNETTDSLPRNVFRVVSTFSKRPPPTPTAKLISEKHVGLDGNFSIHRGFVLAGVLEDRCVYISLDNLQKGHIPLSTVTIGDETVQVVDQKCTPFAHVRQIQTQLPTRPPASEARCETNLSDWNTSTDLIGNSINFLHDDATILGLTTAVAEVVEESPSSTGIFTNQPHSTIITPEESQQELINLYETSCTQTNGNNAAVNPLGVQYYHQQSEPLSHQQRQQSRRQQHQSGLTYQHQPSQHEFISSTVDNEKKIITPEGKGIKNKTSTLAKRPRRTVNNKDSNKRKKNSRNTNDFHSD